MARYLENFSAKDDVFCLRNAEEADAEKLFTFMDIIDRETTFLAREPGEFRQSYTLEQERTLLRGWADGDTKLFLVAETQTGDIAATCGCGPGSDRLRLKHKAELAISVRQDFWRQGLGRKLISIQLDWWKQRGIERMTLEVDTLNTRALGLYLAIGFEVEGTLRREAKMADGSYRDYYFMGKFL